METTQKKKVSKKTIIISVILAILSIVCILGIMWFKGVFYKIGKYTSPDGTTTTTVYDCQLGYNDFPSPGGFTLSDEGQFSGRTSYTDAVFRELWWSPNSNYQVVSMFTEEEIWLVLNDYTRNSSVNLSHRLEMTLYENEFFAKVPYDADGWRDISFDFVQWSNADPELMLVYFSYTDVQDEFHEGYMWYDYESGISSGEIEIIQGEKETHWLNDAIDDLY